MTLSTLLASFFLHHCALSQEPMRRRRITLRQDMFTEGTLRITESNLYVVFGEDIVFDPNSDYETSPNEEGAYFPRDATLYPGSDGTRGSFRLGFFAGISLEGNNIEVNMDGHTFSVSPAFQLQQRFFTLFGVGKGPFIDGEGPTDFGPDIEVNNIHIHNGILGLTPHHGIHGNFVNNIEINNLIFKDFELAGIHLNGFSNVYIHDVEIGPALTNIPVLGRYTQARDGILSFRKMSERIQALGLSDDELNEQYSVEFVGPNSDEPRNVVEIVDRLFQGMDAFFNKKIKQEDDDIDADIYENALLLFDNKEGLADGGAQYGIVLNSAGVAVNWFGFQTTDYSQDAVISDVNIHDLNGNPTETVVYFNEAGDHVTGPFKSVLSMNLLMDLSKFDPETFDLKSDSVDNYHSNLLADAQIALAIYGNEDEKQLSTVDDEFVQWSLGSFPLEDGQLVCNGDAQFHMIKGLVGIRVDRVNNLFMNDIVIDGVTNHGGVGSKFCNHYSGNSVDIAAWASHPETPETEENWKYQGRVARGIALTDVTGEVELDDIRIDNIVSHHGSAIAIDLIGQAAVSVELEGDIEIDGVRSGFAIDSSDYELYKSAESFPNYKVMACSLNEDFNENGVFDDDSQSLEVDVVGIEYCSFDDTDMSDDSEEGNGGNGGGGNGGGRGRPRSRGL